ncbi:unnamed protein product [Rotaria socialis]
MNCNCCSFWRYCCCQNISSQVEHPAPNNNNNIIVHQPSSIRPHHSPSPPTLNSSTSSNNTKVGEESRSIDPTSQNLNSLPTKVIIPQPQIQQSTTPNLIFSTNFKALLNNNNNRSTVENV